MFVWPPSSIFHQVLNFCDLIEIFKCKCFFSFVHQLEFLHKLETFRHIQLNRISLRRFYIKKTFYFMMKMKMNVKILCKKKTTNNFKLLRQWSAKRNCTRVFRSMIHRQLKLKTSQSDLVSSAAAENIHKIAHSHSRRESMYGSSLFALTSHSTHTFV